MANKPFTMHERRKAKAESRYSHKLAEKVKESGYRLEVVEKKTQEGNSHPMMMNKNDHVVARGGKLILGEAFHKESKRQDKKFGRNMADPEAYTKDLFWWPVKTEEKSESDLIAEEVELLYGKQVLLRKIAGVNQQRKGNSDGSRQVMVSSNRWNRGCRSSNSSKKFLSSKDEQILTGLSEYKEDQWDKYYYGNSRYESGLEYSWEEDFYQGEWKEYPLNKEYPLWETERMQIEDQAGWVRRKPSKKVILSQESVEAMEAMLSEDESSEEEILECVVCPGEEEDGDFLMLGEEADDGEWTITF